MTELKHGSNVAGLQTEAILDVHTDEWIVNVRGLQAWPEGGASGPGRDRCRQLPRVRMAGTDAKRFVQS